MSKDDCDNSLWTCTEQVIDGVTLNVWRHPDIKGMCFVQPDYDAFNKLGLMPSPRKNAIIVQLTD